MAEKKFLENVDSQDELVKRIRDSYGDKTVVNAESIVDEDVRIVPLTPRLDIPLNGGIPDGTWTTLTGITGCGKTTLALHYAAKCQRPENGNREVYYINIEGRLKRINLKGIPGLDLKKFHAISSHKKKILSGQDFLQIAEELLRNQENIVVILDSYSALCHENELIGDVGMSTRGSGGYALLSQFCRQMCNVVPVMKSNVIGITHLMANVGSPYGGLTEKSGTSLTYHADIRLRAKKFELWKTGNTIIGQQVTWSCTKSALGGPGGEADSYIRYGHGVDELYELLCLGKDFGLIEESAKGGWHTFNYANREKAQGGEAAYKLLRDTPELRNLLIEKLKGFR